MPQLVSQNEAQDLFIPVGQCTLQNITVDHAKGPVARHAGGRGVEGAVAVLYVQFRHLFEAQLACHVGPQCMGYPGHAGVDVTAGKLLRQRPDGEFLGIAQERVAVPAALNTPHPKQRSMFLFMSAMD